MYKVTLDEKTLFYPGDLECALTKAALKRALNDAGAFNITVPTSNPLFNSFKRRISEAVIYKNDEEIWRGEVRKEGLNLKKEKNVYIVGELAYLNASSQPQRELKDKTPQQMLGVLLDYHNANVESRKQFQLGIVTLDANYYDWTTNYEGTLDYIRTEMCENLGGNLRIRRVNGVRYLDLVKLQDYGKISSQAIEFGSNLLDFTSDIDADEIATVVRPLGKKLEESEFEDLDKYVTIESVNDGSDCIENEDAINSGIGKVCRTVHFNVLEDPAAVYTAGVNWLEDKQFENMELTVSAVDLSGMNVDVEELNLGDYVHTLAKPFGMDRWAYITEDSLDLLNPATKRNVNIGEKVKQSYTQQSNTSQGEIKKKIPTESRILALAKMNATEMITNASKGYIYDVFDENGNRIEQLIMDTNDITTAKKVWRWNIAGLGYSNKGIDGPYELAMTMDGGFVADFITTGILNADLLKTGMIKSTDGLNWWDLVNGQFNMASGVIKITGKVRRTGADYTSDDIDKIGKITIGLYEPTVEELEKYDLNGDQVITTLDLVRANRLLQGIDEYFDLDTTIEINPQNHKNIIKTAGVAIGVYGIYADALRGKKVYASDLYVPTGTGDDNSFRAGTDGSFTTADGKTITVNSGVITSIL